MIGVIGVIVAINPSIAPANPALRGIRKCYRRVEMRARESESENQGYQCRAVASVLASRAMVILPPANFSPMIPEPTTAARRKRGS